MNTSARICIVCVRVLESSHMTRKYCSRRCQMRAYRERHPEDVSEYNASRRRRRADRRKAGRRCGECGKSYVPSNAIGPSRYCPEHSARIGRHREYRTVNGDTVRSRARDRWRRCRDALEQQWVAKQTRQFGERLMRDSRFVEMLRWRRELHNTLFGSLDASS